MHKNRQQQTFIVTLLTILCYFDASSTLSINGAIKAELFNDLEVPPRAMDPPSPSTMGVYDNAAVSADGVPCAQIGTDILQQGGTAVDAAIASMFCLGVVNTQSTGIGGGFLMTYYNKSSGEVYTLDARETAPGLATANMFQNASSAYGGLAVAVPGESKGTRAAYDRFGGGVAWEDLIEPTIQLCEQGFPINNHMGDALKSKEDHILDEPSMSIFINNQTGSVWQEGDIMYRYDLSPTLRTLQVEPDALYTGSLSAAFQQDLQSLGSIITSEDLANYEVKWKDPISVSISNGNYSLFSFPPPGSGAIYAFILNVLDNYNFNTDSINENEIVTTYQRIVETFKYAYARRTELGDPDYSDQSSLVGNLTSEAYAYDIYSRITDGMTFQDPTYYGARYSKRDNHGTSHLSVLAPNGDAVAVTATVNWYFGAVIRSVQTGVVLNNEMDDFHTNLEPNSYGLYPCPANFIEPGKRPRSSMSPSILVDPQGDARIIVGAAGGSHITTATAWTTAQNIWFGLDIKESIDSRRLHHPLMPMTLNYELGFDQDIVGSLEEIGHVIKPYSVGTSIVCGISRDSDGQINAFADYRKRGEVDGF